MTTLVVTQGDPEGVGPELILRAAADGLLLPGDVVFAGSDTLSSLAPRLPGWAVEGLERLRPLLQGGADLGQVAALEMGIARVLEGGAALVTAPIDKARARAEGLQYTGHTELLAHRSGASRHAMAMIGPRLRVALATIHIPLREVPHRLEAGTIADVGLLLAAYLTANLGVAAPRIGVLGLNPHAGEAGLLGHEDEAIVAPGVARANLRAAGGARFFGPLPGDAAFHHHAQGDYDGLVAMYHDQGLAPFKLMHFHDGVNVTLGLPFVRTSPDHGTARDIAGRGVADPRSFFAALRLARGDVSG